MMNELGMNFAVTDDSWDGFVTRYLVRRALVVANLGTWCERDGDGWVNDGPNGDEVGVWERDEWDRRTLALARQLEEDFS